MGSRPTGLVGRDSELRRLRALLDDVLAGRGRGCLLLGEAGIGKTTLVEAVADDALARGLAVDWGRCTDAESLPYWPWVQVLGGLRGDDGPALFAVERYASRAGLFAGVADALATTTRAGPRMVIIEDAQWVDPSSLELLRFVASVLPGWPLLVVVTAREDEAAHELGRLPSSLDRILLTGLDEQATRALVAAIVGESADEAFVSEIRRRTAGNPFFAGELARLQVMRGGGLRSLPAGIRQVLEYRFARLPQPSFETLQGASVLGRVDVGVLSVVLGREAGDVRAALDAPRRAQLIVDGEDRPRFAHDLVREALYEGLGARRRAELHRAVAEALPNAASAELAAHWREADGADAPRRAGEFARRAGDAAMANMAFEQAERFYRDALEHSDDPVEAGLGLGRALVFSGRVEEGRARLRELAAAARTAGRTEQMAQALLAMGGGLGGFEVEVADQSQVDLLEAAAVGLGPGETALRAAVLARLSLAGARRYPRDRCVGLARSALEMARRVGDQATEVAALAALCDALAGPDHVNERSEMSTHMVVLARSLGDPPLELLARRLRIVAALERGEFSAADADVVAYERVADRLRLPLYRWQVPMWRGMRAAMNSDYEAALEHATAVDALADEADSMNAFMMAWALRLIVARQRGDVAALDALHEQILPFLSDYPPWDCCLVALHASAGRLDEARGYLDRVMRRGLDSIPKDSEWLELLWMLADGAVAVGDLAAAAAVRAAVAPYRALWAIDGIGAACFGPVSTLLDQLDAALADRRPTERSDVGIVTDIEQGAFIRAGALWQLRFRGREASVVHSKGMTDLARLLQQPGGEIHVLDLYETADSPAGHRAARPGDTGPVLDATARTAYRAHLIELEEEIARAGEDGDSARAEQLRAERDFIVGELTRALGLGGRSRVTGDPVERARKAVAMRISTALRSIEQAHPELGRHLRNSVSTGRFCSYHPDRRIEWRA